jgi:hypothetical protein
VYDGSIATVTYPRSAVVCALAERGHAERGNAEPGQLQDPPSADIKSNLSIDGTNFDMSLHYSNSLEESTAGANQLSLSLGGSAV